MLCQSISLIFMLFWSFGSDLTLHFIWNSEVAVIYIMMPVLYQLLLWRQEVSALLMIGERLLWLSCMLRQVHLAGFFFFFNKSPATDQTKGCIHWFTHKYTVLTKIWSTYLTLTTPVMRKRFDDGWEIKGSAGILMVISS